MVQRERRPHRDGRFAPRLKTHGRRRARRPPNPPAVRRAVASAAPEEGRAVFEAGIPRNPRAGGPRGGHGRGARGIRGGPEIPGKKHRINRALILSNKIPKKIIT